MITNAKCSVITPRGEGGIGVIMLYGSDALAVLNTCFKGSTRCAEKIQPGRIAHGKIIKNGTVLDEVVVAHLNHDQNITGQSCYEVNCHGGALAVKTVTERLVEGGAKLVTWRKAMCESAAHESNTPLSREAIRNAALNALPVAETQPAAVMLLHQAEGALYNELAQIAENLRKKQNAEKRLNLLSKSAKGGKAILNPPKVMLAGPPNAGKSTLLNALMMRERAIVHHTPGTTRDVVKDRLAIKGMPFDIMDSAGIRCKTDSVEEMAVKHTLDLIGETDMLLFLFDIRKKAADSFHAIEEALKNNTRILYVANKCDLLDKEPDETELPLKLPHTAPRVCISAKEKQGIEELEKLLLEPYGDIIERCNTGRPTVFNQYQQRAIEKTIEMLRENGPEHAAKILLEAGVKD